MIKKLMYDILPKLLIFCFKKNNWYDDNIDEKIIK